MVKCFKIFKNHLVIFHTPIVYCLGYHGDSGPVHVHTYTGSPMVRDIYMEASKELGIPEVDINGPNQQGKLTLEG